MRGKEECIMGAFCAKCGGPLLPDGTCPKCSSPFQAAGGAQCVLLDYR